jgi:hypothetical protein|tara:strand:+ start:2415 stop:3065 length:651 start_codon:yes stop_codon:yes gene_type:complete
MKYTFKKNGFIIVKNSIPEMVVYFCKRYLMLKERVVKTFLDTNYISPYQEEHGYIQDPYVKNCFAVYGDIAMEVLLAELLPIMQKETGEELVPTYSYARIYHKGSVLHKHKDRDSCEISTTINLGGEPWSFYINPNEKEGSPPNNTPSSSKGIEINLKPGDMLIYKGCLLEHWRKPFKGENCFQVFLHYNKKNKKNNNLFDGRRHLGLPDNFEEQV